MKNEDRERAQRELGELRCLMYQQLLALAMIGCSFRMARSAGGKQELLDALSDNDMHAQLSINAVNRLEALIRSGQALNIALDTLIAEGYAAKDFNLTLGKLGE